MMRLLLKTSLAFARQLKRTKPNTHNQPALQNQHHQPPPTLKNQYQSVKQRVEREDQKAKQQIANQPKINDPASYFKKMMAEAQNQDQSSQPLKEKIDISEKLKKLGTPQNLLSPQNREKRKKQVDSLISAIKEKEERQKVFELKMFEAEFKAKFPQKVTAAEQTQKQLQYKLKMAEQDVLLNQIMKITKEKEITYINKKEDKADEQGLTEKEKRLIIREEKIIQALQNNQDPSQAKYQLTTQDVLAMKYSPEIIAKAQQYKNYQLGYLKQLIFNQTHQASQERNIIDRRTLLTEDDSKYKQLTKADENKKKVPNTYKTMKSEDGLQLYEDVQFYKSKAVKQIKEKEQLDAEDKLIQESFKKDLKLGNKISDVFLDEVVYPEDAKIKRKIDLKETSFGKQKEQEKSIAERLNKLGLQFTAQDIKTLSRQNLFQDKKLLQEQQNFQKYLHKKEKKKNMKKQLRQIHQSVMKDDVDFDRNVDSVMTIKELKDSNNIEMLEQNYQRINKFYEQKQTNFVQQTPEQKKAKIHFTKTFRNMQGMLAMYFANGLFNHGVNQLESIQIQQVIPNSKNTVLNIFWNIEPSYLHAKGIVPGVDKYQELLQKEKKKFEVSLKNQSSYISGKMTQFLRLRYGPEIRFHFDKKTEETVEAVNELKQFTKEIAMVEVQQLMKKGKISSEQKQLEYFQKMLIITRTKIQEFNSRKLLLSKSFNKKEKKRQDMIDSQLKKQEPAQTDSLPKKKKKRVNPMYQQEALDQESQNAQKQQKSKKKSPKDKLWQTIDAL